MAAAKTAPMFASLRVNTPWLQDPGVDVSVAPSFIGVAVGDDAAHADIERLVSNGSE